ncbi:hypothetical protein Poli38472_011271 [Pythium oligandrum]|uniref:DML1/Misato tubulin domain-containing protein n=1 Tax=Pythium oligandrum TaxID=41045 RepID=A0A8K1FLY6_PYTOL|nr:hypothetical protein Poli38472_011271 [Pythium oligandrum]|eukprot:TMW67651.1 hypothetical protein Poli38472_011271 [Pythium oligandrum]
MTMPMEETLRLAFGTAATTTATQWHAIERANGGHAGLEQVDGRPRFIAFEAKGRIQRRVSATSAIHRGATQPQQAQSEASSWSGNVQVYDQSESDVSSAPTNAGLWDWEVSNEKNLVEVSEFRPYMPLHNFYEGQSVTRDGSVSVNTLEMIEDHVRGVLEECDNLRFVQALVDMDSAWGGLAVEVLTYLNEECPSAIVATYGNDWAYPLPDQSEVSVYSTGIEGQDKSKVAARRRINVASSISALTECSNVMIPLAMAKSTRRYETASQDCIAAASTVATALELAMSAFREEGTSVYHLLEGTLPSMKVLELGSLIPFNTDASLLLEKEKEYPGWTAASLLPQLASRGSTTLLPPRFRRLHLRGAMSQSSSLQRHLERFDSQDCVVQWSLTPLHLSRASAPVDGVSQLALSSAVGQYLHHVATQLPRKQQDRRILYEFTQAGMNVDALEELDASMQAMSGAYPTNANDDHDDIDDLMGHAFQN